MNAISADVPANTVNISAYLARIGYAGDRAPTLETLISLHRHHTQTIAFENLNPLLNLPVLLDLRSLQQKLIHSGRGGYCFEQNLLFSAVLAQLGFEVTQLAARVRWRLPPDVTTPRTHMVLMVQVDGQPYLADVGFGGGTLPTPIRLLPDVSQPTSHEPFKLTLTAEIYTLYVQLGEDWQPLYQFDLQPQAWPDYEVKSWYVSTHPNSIFVQTLMVAKPGETCRYALRDRQFTTYYLNGQVDQRELRSVDEFLTVFADPFGITVPDHPNLSEMLRRFIESSSG